MKKILLSIIFLFLCPYAFAQIGSGFDQGSAGPSGPGGSPTTPGGSGGSIQYNSGSAFAGVSNSSANSNGNIGVGTTNPRKKLHIAGTDPTILMQYTPASNYQWAIRAVDNGYGNSTNFGIFDSADGGSTYNLDMFFWPSSASNGVGIGTFNVDSRLVVQGHTDISSSIFRVKDTNATDIFTIYGNGNIGVSTANPSQKLDINGLINSSGFHTNNATGSWTSSAGMNIDPTGAGTLIHIGSDRNVGIGTTLPGTAFDLNGTGRMTGFNLTGNGAAASRVLVSNSLGVGTWMAASTLPNSGTPGGSSPQLQYNSSSSFGGVSGSGVDSNGNVGLGSAVPGQKLDVNGVVRITPLGTRTAPALTIGADNSGFYVPATNQMAVGMTNAGLPLMTWDATSYVNVGIGTLAPSLRFEVNGTGAVDTNNTSGILLTDTGNAASRRWFIGNGNNNYGNLSFDVSASKTSIPTYAQEKMSLTSAGNLGLGVVLPANILSVNGGASIGNNSVAPTNGLLVTGNVGVGTASPSSLLDVGGNMYLDRSTSAIIMKDSGGGGGCSKITLNTGTLTAATVTCP